MFDYAYMAPGTQLQVPEQTNFFMRSFAVWVGGKGDVFILHSRIKSTGKEIVTVLFIGPKV